MCDSHSFAQRKLFVLEIKRLWLPAATTRGPRQWAHLGPATPLQCLAHSCLCSTNSLYSVHSRKPTSTSAHLNKSDLHPLLHVPAGPPLPLCANLPPTRPPHVTALICGVCLSSYLSVPFLDYEVLWMERMCLYTTEPVPGAWLVLRFLGDTQSKSPVNSGREETRMSQGSGQGGWDGESDGTQEAPRPLV